MSHTCRVEFDGCQYDLPVIEGTEGERAIDISRLRGETGFITLDDGYSNTGSCTSAITYIDGEQGILRYRGIPIEELAENSSFVEVAWLIIFGRLPTPADRDRFSALLTENSMLPDSMRKHFDAFPPHAHPDGHPLRDDQYAELHTSRWRTTNDEAGIEQAAARLMSKVRTIAAASYKSSVGEPLIYPRYDYKYCENFLHMMFSLPFKEYVPTPEVDTGAEPVPAPARRPRAELLDQHGPDGGLQPGQHVRQLRRRRLRPVGTPARRGERRGDRDAGEPPANRG